MDSKGKAILKTLLYANLFDYPLKKTEIFRFLIAEKKIGKHELSVALDSQCLSMEESDGYYYLSGRMNLVKKRRIREGISAQKLKKAKEIIKKIIKLETIINNAIVLCSPRLTDFHPTIPFSYRRRTIVTEFIFHFFNIFMLGNIMNNKSGDSISFNFDFTVAYFYWNSRSVLLNSF